MTDNKLKYKTFCETHPEIPLFSQYWWMEAACVGGSWDVILVEKPCDIIASMPYMIGSKMGQKYILQPQLTQTNGIYFNYPKGLSEEERLGFEKEVCTEIISQLEKLGIALFMQNFHFSFTNWLPFYWNHFFQTTRYTYIIENISDIDEVLKKFSSAKQRQIRKAQRAGFIVDHQISPEAFYEYHCHVLQQQGEKNLNSKEVELSIIRNSIQRNQGAILGIKDNDGNLHSALFLVWDKNCAYYLIPATDSNFRSSGASSLIVYEAIKFVHEKCSSFDFEGSMSENIERSYRQFGTKQVPYFQIGKCYNLLFKIWKILKS